MKANQELWQRARGRSIGYARRFLLNVPEAEFDALGVDNENPALGSGTLAVTT